MEWNNSRLTHCRVDAEGFFADGVSVDALAIFDAQNLGQITVHQNLRGRRRVVGGFA